ncbi:putative choline transporter, neither null mutation nor overexpression affects choline transport [Podila verticillata]|nr:putative choline transporter, neither null mutation nor overexpression affects choline transport [Podila verticillata]
MAEYYHLPDNPHYLQQQHPVPYGVHPQPTYPPQHPVPYGVHPQPTYQPHHLQGRWGHDQVAQQYAYSGSPLPPPQTSWTLSPPAHSPPQQSSYPEYELASIGHQAPPYRTGIPESEKPEKFKPASKYNDLRAMFAFLIQMAGFTVLSAFSVNNIIKAGIIKSGDKGIIEKDFFLSTNVMMTFALGIGISVVYSYLYLLLTHLFPLWSMPATYWFIMFVLFGSAGFCLYSKIWVTAAFFLLLGVLFTKTYLNARERIKSSVVLLKEVTAIARHYPAVFFLSFIGLFLQILCNIHILVVITGLRQMFSAQGSSDPLHICLHIVAYFSFYWLSQVLTNIVHVTVSGVFATHYFKSGSGSPTWASLKRACTTSFGTICFGGMIYAIIQTIKKILDFLRGDGNHCLACVFEACFHWINEALEFITPLVYCEVAIYGKPFITAAKDVFKIVKDRGLDQVLNDIIISTVWGIGAFFGAFVAAIGCQYYLMMTMGGEDGDNVKHHKLEVWIITGLTFFLGMQVIFTAGAVIQSGVATIFVALAEDPDALAKTKPKFFATIQAAYPDIVQGVHH